MKHKCMLFKYPKNGMDYRTYDTIHICAICSKEYTDEQLEGIFGDIRVMNPNLGFVPEDSEHPLADEVMYIAPSIAFSPMIEMFICEFERYKKGR